MGNLPLSVMLGISVIDDRKSNIRLATALGSGCGSVGRAVASDTRGPRFESSHWQNLLNIYLLSTVLKRRK